MQLSFTSLCQLCGESHDVTLLTPIHSEKGKVEKLESLIDQYIIPILIVPKDDKLCICDTCKTRLLTWDAFIESCRKAQEMFKTVLEQGQKNIPSSSAKRAIDSAVAWTNGSLSSGPQKKKKSSNYCIARWCNKGNYQGVSLFRLPRDRNRALTWLSAAERADLKHMATFNSYYLCANHFMSNMFTNKAHNQLIKGAVPTLFPKSPYVDKPPVKTAASQMLATQLQGVKFKSILPKISSNNTSMAPLSNAVFQESVEVMTDELKPERSWNPVVLHVLPQMTQNQLSTASDHNPMILEVISSNPIHRFYPPKNAIHVIESDPLPVNSTTTSKVTRNQGCTSSLLDPLKNQIPAAIGKEDSKQRVVHLEEIEPCFPADEYSSRSLPAVESSMEGSCLSVKFKEENASVGEPSYIGAIGAHCKNLDSQAEDQHACEPYESSVGSQDVLLPHVSKSRTSTADMREQNFMLRSTLSHGVSIEGNSLLSNNNEMSSPNMGLFDLRPDEMQGTGNATFSNIVNLDELMDLDHYFNR